MADDKPSPTVEFLGPVGTGTSTPPRSHHRVRNPLHRLLHPNGHTVHVANTPEHAENLKRELSNVHGDKGFDVCIRGSNEHIETIHTIRAHHEQRRDALRAQPAVSYDDFEAVHTELDTLHGELNALATQGQSVSLDANFSKYGYSARIRTYQDDSEDSRRTSLSSSTDGKPLSTNSSLKPTVPGLKFWRRPTVRQYWHKGLIWRASTPFATLPIENFVDLIYVAILAIMGDLASEHPSGSGLLHFVVTFILSWLFWSELTMLISWFANDDIVQRLSVLFFMASVMGFTMNISRAFEEGRTYTLMISFYLVQRLFEALYFVLLSFWIPMMRGPLLAHALLILLGGAIWVGSICVDMPQRYAPIFIAIVFDLFGYSLLMPMVLHPGRLAETALKPIVKHMQFYPALNIEHKTERTGAFVTLVFGYSVVALLFQSAAQSGINSFYGKAVLGLIVAFSFNMLYFEIDGANLHVHAIRRHAGAYAIWQWIHLPFIMGYILGMGALAKMVIAHDSHHFHVEDLTETWQERSEEEISIGLRWYLCAGIGIALLCTGIISAAHEHKALEGVRFSKLYRLVMRTAVSIILICLPLAEGLDSLKLIGTVTGLIVFVLLVDLWGVTCPKESFWWEGRECGYAAECRLRKRDLEPVQKGEVENVEELAKRQRGEKR